jgi:hypothetical protein
MAPAIPLLMNSAARRSPPSECPASARCTWGASNRNQNFHLRGYGARVKNFIDITALAVHRLRGWRNGGSQRCRLLRPWRHRSDDRWTGSRLGSVLGALLGGRLLIAVSGKRLRLLFVMVLIALAAQMLLSAVGSSLTADLARLERLLRSTLLEKQTDPADDFRRTHCVFHDTPRRRARLFEIRAVASKPARQPACACVQYGSVTKIRQLAAVTVRRGELRTTTL